MCTLTAQTSEKLCNQWAQKLIIHTYCPKGLKVFLNSYNIPDIRKAIFKVRVRVMNLPTPHFSGFFPRIFRSNRKQFHNDYPI